jgi:hypothetical protein
MGALTTQKLIQKFLITNYNDLKCDTEQNTFSSTKLIVVLQSDVGPFTSD